MKKIIISIFVLLSAFDLYPQQKKPVRKPVQPIVHPKPQPTQSWIGIFAGPNLNYLDYHDKITTIKGENIAFHAGVFYQRNFNKCFAVQPALIFAIRGGKIKDVDSTVNASLMNIELPINFLSIYKHIMIGAGPDFSYGIYGRLKTNKMERNAYNASESFERTLKRFEFGCNFLIGYTLKNGIFITANFSSGFINIYKGDGSAPGNVRAGTKLFGLSLGHLFGLPSDTYQ